MLINVKNLYNLFTFSFIYNIKFIIIFFYIIIIKINLQQIKKKKKII